MTALEKYNTIPTFILNGQNLTHFEFPTINRPQSDKRFQIVSDIINKPKMVMEQDLHLLCLMGRASRANKVLLKLANKEIAWQRNLLPQAQALKTEFLEKYGDYEKALRRLRNIIDDVYMESFEKGMIHTLAICLLKHTEPKCESHILAYKRKLETLNAKRKSKRNVK